jgi:uncharacterized protein YdeI (YjbR/CyaY-like superfamily)
MHKMKILGFASARELRAWLVENHRQSKGFLLRIYKKDSGMDGVNYADALDQALCYGWIDGQKLPGDKQSWLQTFTPRRPKSGWSKKNTERAERLIKSGKMTASGLQEIDAAKADGRWQAAYDSFGSASIPEDFLQQLAGNKKAKAFFATLDKTNLYSIAYRLQTAKKPETREKRMLTIIEMLERGEKFR